MYSDTSSCWYCCKRAKDQRCGYHGVRYQHLKVIFVKSEASNCCSEGKPGLCDDRVSEAHVTHAVRTLTLTHCTPCHQASDMITALAPWSSACLSPLLWFLMILSCSRGNQTRCSTQTETWPRCDILLKSRRKMCNYLSNIFNFIQREWGCFNRKCFLSSHTLLLTGGKDRDLFSQVCSRGGNTNSSVDIKT